jgi:hypothetical protein
MINKKVHLTMGFMALFVWASSIFMINTSISVYKKIPEKVELKLFEGKLTGIQCTKPFKSVKSRIYISAVDTDNEIHRMYAITKAVSCQWLDAMQNSLIGKDMRVLFEEESKEDHYMWELEVWPIKLITYEAEKKYRYNSVRSSAIFFILLSLLFTGLYFLRLIRDKSTVTAEQ